MIKAQYVLLAEFQREGRENTMDVFGIFDRVTATQLPAQHPEMVLLVLLTTDDREDLGAKEMSVSCQLPSGKPLFRQPLRVEFRAGDAGPWLASSRVAFEMQGLPIPEPGRYVLSLEYNNALLASHPFMVSLIKQL